MSHLVFLEDADGDVIDQIAFCSDHCARTHDNYSGWNGCVEILTTEPCGNFTECGNLVEGIH